MDSRQREQKEKARQQGLAFQRLIMHPDWEFYRLWVEKARTGYENKAHDPSSRDDHVTLARALEGYDALNNLLVNLDRSIANIPKLNEELDGPGHPGKE